MDVQSSFLSGRVDLVKGFLVGRVWRGKTMAASWLSLVVEWATLGSELK